jgi:hypothetical protein
MDKLIEKKIMKIIREAWEDCTFGNVKKFSHYTKDEAEQNRRSAVYTTSNPSYEDFMRWKRVQIAKGVPARELSFARYREETNK